MPSNVAVKVGKPFLSVKLSVFKWSGLTAKMFGPFGSWAEVSTVPGRAFLLTKSVTDVAETPESEN
jgi:hypothetical protein